MIQRLICVLALWVLLLPKVVLASPILQLTVGSDGRLNGATGVQIEGNFYDVRFVDATCAVVFDGCDITNFVFTTETAALAASRALLDLVLTDVPNVGNFDSVPTLTNGCIFPANCWILTPYAIMGDSFLVTQTLNDPSLTAGDGYFVHQPTGPGLSIIGYDAAADINGVVGSGNSGQVFPEILIKSAC
jgi:hypothetical protein